VSNSPENGPGGAPELPRWTTAVLGAFLAAFVALAFYVFIRGGQLIEVLDAFY
jgi:hypothetical protein